MKINISTTTVVKNRNFKAGIKIKCNNIECYGYDDCYECIFFRDNPINISALEKDNRISK